MVTRQWISIGLMAIGFVLIAVSPAEAQAASGALGQAFQWVMMNVIQVLIMGVVVGIGVMLMMSHHPWAGAAFMLVGLTVVSQYREIAAFFPVG